MLFFKTRVSLRLDIWMQNSMQEASRQTAIPLWLFSTAFAIIMLCIVIWIITGVWL